MSRARLWPGIDHFKALAPDTDQPHPIDGLIDGDARIRRVRRRVLRLQKALRLPEQDAQQLFRELCDARLLLESLQAELAFNLGVDLGTVVGRQTAVGRLRSGDRRGALSRAVQTLLADTPMTASERVLLLLQTAWSLAAGPASLPSRQRVSANRFAVRTKRSKTASR